MYKTTKKDFEEFKKECEYWIEYFGLKEWELHWEHAKCSVESRRAEVSYNVYGRIATFTMNTEIQAKEGKKLAPLAGKDFYGTSAFHEVCELLIAPLYNMATYTFNAEEVQKESHTIIQRLINTIFKEKRG
jgi:hypothetical protein